MTRLETIATRQSSSRLRTAAFAACLALASVVSAASVQAAVVGAHAPAARR